MIVRHKEIRVLLIGANLWYVGEGMFGPLLSVYTERIGGSILDLTGAWSVYLLVTGLCMLVVGASADRPHAPARLMVAGYVLNAICTFAYLLVVTPSQLLLVQAGLGLANALATPTWDVLYSAQLPPNHSGMVWGMAHGMEYLITSVAILIGGYVVYLGSFTLLFSVMGMIQLIAAVYQAQILRVEVAR
jgi:MFS-type transporter involved in bile tolerance (Atg22 family)